MIATVQKKVQIATPEEDADPFCFKPNLGDIALLGRNILNSPYARLWRAAIMTLSNYACGTLYNGISQSNVSFSLTLMDTAAINMVTREIYLNPIFLRKWIKSPYDLAGLILHELLHPVIDPTNKHSYGQVGNVVSDALINSTIFRISPSLCSLMNRFYKTDEFPGCLLRPGSTKNWFYATIEEAEKRVPIKKITMVPGPDGKPVKRTLQYPARKRHLDIYRNLFPSPRNIPKAVRPGLEALREAFFTAEDEEELDGGGSISIGVGVAGKGKGKAGKGSAAASERPEGQETLTGFDGDNTVTIEDLMEIPDGLLEKIQEISDELDKKHGSKAGDNSGKGEGSSGNNSGGKGAGKGGTLKDTWTELDRKENIFRQKNQLTQQQRVKAAKQVIDGIYGRYRRDAFQPNESDSLGTSVKLIEEMLLDDGIMEAFFSASERDIRGEIVQLLEEKPKRNRSIIPKHMTRAAPAMLAMGGYPLWWKQHSRQPDEQKRTTRVYVDVSGSMLSQIPWVLRLVVEMEHRCHSDIWLFSTKIVETTIEELKKGEYKTTGGTSFDEVLEHFLEQEEDIENCLIITDGEDKVSPEVRKKLEGENKNPYVLIVERHTPSKSTVLNAQKWATKVFLKEKSWWGELGLRP